MEEAVEGECGREITDEWHDILTKEFIGTWLLFIWK
jgi:hypothetical protein